MNAPQTGGAERLIVNARHLGPQENRRPRGPRKKSSPPGRMGEEDVDEQEDAGQAPPTGRPPTSVRVAGRGTVGARTRKRRDDARRAEERRRRKRSGGGGGGYHRLLAARRSGYWATVVGRTWLVSRTHARKLSTGTPLSTVAAATQYT